VLLEVEAFQRLSSRVRGGGLKAQLIRGVFGVGGLKLLSLLLTLCTSVLLARGLGPEGYGKYAFVLSIVTMLALPVGPGIAQLVTREVAKHNHGGEWGLLRGALRRAHQWSVIGSAVIVVLIVSIFFNRASWTVDDRWTMLIFATAMLPLLGLNSIRNATLRGFGKASLSQVPEQLIRPGLHLLIAFCLLLFNEINPTSALVSQIVATSIAFWLGTLILLRLKPTEVGQSLPMYKDREWAYAILPFVLMTAVSTFNSHIGVLVLGVMGSDEGVAGFRIAVSGAMIVALSLVIVNVVIGPQIVRAHRDQDIVRLQRLSKLSARGALAVALPLALAFVFWGGQIVSLVYGETYKDMVTLPLVILAIGQLISVAFGSVGLLLTMSGFERHTLIGQIIALMVNALACLLFVPILGATGAAVAVSLSLITWNVILAVSVFRKVGIRPSFI